MTVHRNDSQIITEQALRVIHDPVARKNTLCLTDEKHEAVKILTLHKLAKRLLEATAADFHISSPMGKYFIFHVKHTFRFCEIFSQHKVSPYTELYQEFFCNIRQSTAWNEDPMESSIGSRRMNLIKEQALAMREKFASADFKKNLKAIQRSVNKNRKNLLEYFNELFARDKTLLILRLNIGYSEEEYQRQSHRAQLAQQHDWNPLSTADGNPSISNRPGLMPCQLPGLSLQDVVLHREELIRHLRTTLKQKLRGYAWKLDYTQYKGYQYHLVIFLDPALANADLPCAQQIGKHWEEVITQGHGLCYDHHEVKKSYRFCATGVKSHADPDLSDDLVKVADYLMRPDLYIQLVLPDKHRTLGKGGIKTKSETKSPRDRK